MTHAVTHRVGRPWIRRTGGKTNGLRAFLWGATIPGERLEEAVAALRGDTEHEIPNVVLTLKRMSKLGL